jgi:hypothetical protein
MTTAIIPQNFKTGTAVTMRVTITNDNGLRDENGTATIIYWLYDVDGNTVTDGNKPVNGEFTNGWDGSVNAAFSFIANYLGVKIS